MAGQALIQGGRDRVRRLLYMAAVSAIRHNPDLGRKYRELIARGKPAKVALVAVMRKLLLLANALLRQNRLWAPRSGDEPARDQPVEAAKDAGGTRALRGLPVVTRRWPPAPVANLTPASAQENLATEPRACMHVQLRSNACNTDTHLALDSFWTLQNAFSPVMVSTRKHIVWGVPMKLNLTKLLALCLFALSSSAGAEPSEGGYPDHVVEEVDAFIQSRMPEVTARAQSIVDGMSDETREALWRTIERRHKAEERVETAERRLRGLSSSEEAARVDAEVSALIRERWSEIMHQARSIMESMSDKQRDAFYEALLRTQAASDRQEASGQALEELIGDVPNVDFSPLEGGGDNLFCTFCKARAASFRAKCDRQAEMRNTRCVMECSGFHGSAEDECLLRCEENRKADLVNCAVGEQCWILVCCPPDPVFPRF